MDDEKFSMLALALTSGIGVVKILNGIKVAGSACEIMKMKTRHLREFKFGNEACLSIVSGESERKAEEAVGMAEKKSVKIISLKDDEYPELLKEIYDPPLILYAAGDPGFLRIPPVSIVGARRCTVYGEQVTTYMAREFSEMKLCIVSGMARGIDTRAHLGALSAKEPTIAVLGTGVDVPYPRENRGLYQKIKDSGCILSEFPMGAYPAPQNFPVRNRIISGLSWGTLITEAAEFSGSLITARLALEQNREVWAVPGNITSKTSYGPNYLIKQGAHPLLSPAEIVDYLPVHVLRKLKLEAEIVEADTEDCVSLSRDESTVVNMLFPDRLTSLDHLVSGTGFSWPYLSEILLKLESRDVIKRMSGSHYCKCL